MIRDARHAHLIVIINRNIKLYYDCHDNHEIDETAACKVDCYFKRSYAQSKILDRQNRDVPTARRLGVCQIHAHALTA